MRLDRTRIVISERSQSELLDLALLVTRVFLGPVVGLVLIPAVPLMILNWWLIAWMAADLIEASAILRYLWIMGLLVYVQAPLAATLATLYLGKVTFYEQPTFTGLLREAGRMAHRLLWTQGVMRGLLLVVWLVSTIEVDDSRSSAESLAPFICFGLFVWRCLRPYVNEIVLLEQSPIVSRDGGQVSVGKRSSRLHSPSAGDLFARGLAMAPVTLALGASLLGSLWFLIALFSNDWSWGPVMVHLVAPGVLWLLVVYVTVVRFLSYLDLRIRREGWEVELQLRAEAARLKSRVNMGD